MTYPLDKVIRPLNNWGLGIKNRLTQGKFLRWPIRWPRSVTAISFSPQQFQIHHRNFNFTTALFQLASGYSLVTPFNFITSPRQCQFNRENFNFAHNKFNFFTSIFSTFLKAGNSHSDSEGPFIIIIIIIITQNDIRIIISIATGFTAVAVIAYCVDKMTLTCFPMISIRILFDAIFVV